GAGAGACGACVTGRGLRAAGSARGGAACASGVCVMAQSIVETGTPPITPPSEHRLWGGRFEASPALSLEELNRSLDVDRRLWREDIEGSLAWVQALLRAGVLDLDEAAALDSGLRRVARRLEQEFPDDAPDEDIHTLVERMLYEEAGAVAGKLHTGRSRNDQ